MNRAKLEDKIDDIIWKHLRVLDDSGLYFDGAATEIVDYIMNEVINLCDDEGQKALDDGEARGAWTCSTKFEGWLV